MLEEFASHYYYASFDIQSYNRCRETLLFVCLFVCLFVLMRKVPVNSYGHVGTASLPSHTFSF